MDFTPINPYNVIQELRAENKDLKAENEALKEMLTNVLATSNNGQNAE